MSLSAPMFFSFSLTIRPGQSSHQQIGSDDIESFNRRGVDSGFVYWNASIPAAMNQGKALIVAPEDPGPDTVRDPVLEVFDGDGFLTRFKLCELTGNPQDQADLEAAVRFGFIDAPELGQPGGRDAKDFLTSLIGDQWVELVVLMMLASRLPSILPPLSPRELLEISMIASIAGELTDGKLSDRRPFRAPHHSASMAAMVGGGSRARPGEVSLAHNGVLFLHELPEFTRIM